MTDAVKCEMRNYQNFDNLSFYIRNMNVVQLFSLGATAATTHYLKEGNFCEISTY